MKVRVLQAGDTAVLAELDCADHAGSADDGEDAGCAEAVRALAEALRDAALPGVVELVPGARTVLVQAGIGADLDGLAATVAALAGRTDPSISEPSGPEELVIPVRYDGPDLAEVGGLTGLSQSEVITRHTGTLWRAAFIGFAPGFAYLTTSGGGLAVPRRSESRTMVPAGSVALAGGYSAIYPSASPGGWQLIGSTEMVLWDVDREPPSVIQPGSWVRFVDVSAMTPADENVFGTTGWEDHRR